MKKCSLVFFIVIFLTSTFFFSCSEKKVLEPPVQEEEEEIEIPEHIDLIEERLLPSVVLAPNVSLNILGRDNKMHKMKSLSRGNTFDTVQVNGAVRILNLYDEEENPETYIHAVYDSVDFWIYENYIAKNAVPGIIVEAGDGLKFGQIVALHLSSEETESEESGRVKISYFDREQDKVCEIETGAEKVSTYKDDVEMAAIVEKLRTTTRATPRNELFLKAEKLNASPAMKKILDAEKTEKLSYDYQEVLKTMPGARYIVNVEELNTVDQSKDPFKN